MAQARRLAPGGRFNLLQLDEGETYLSDVAVFHIPAMPSQAHPLPKVRGWLRMCTQSLIFEPSPPEMLPLLKFPLKNITSINQFRNSSVGKLAEGEGGVDVECSLLICFREDDKIGPYVSYPGEQKHTFTPIHSKLDTFFPFLMQLFSAARLPEPEAGATVKQIVEEAEASFMFDLLWLEDGLSEKILFDSKATHISPLVPTPGRLVITTTRIYFQPFCNIAAKPVCKIKRASVGRVYPRRYMFKQVGLELFLNAEYSAMQALAAVTLSAGDQHKSCASLFFVFSSEENRTEALELLSPGATALLSAKVHKGPVVSELAKSLAEWGACDLVDDDEEGAAISAAGKGEAEDDELKVLLKKWQSKEIGNFEYLMALNQLADRSFNDLTQYPVMPWVISDYTSLTLDLEDPNTFRDLSKPMGALDPTRLESLRLRYQEMPEPKFLYGTHYSTPGYVLYYLVRAAPELMLHLQRGRFDAPDRQFVSISSSFRSCITNPADVKELIPEFYSGDGSFLLNTMKLDLGRKQNGEEVNDVELPVWANDAQNFVAMNREALESDHVSGMLHRWIDLIFGYKQQGEEAIASDNLFYYLTYEGSIDWSTVTDEREARSLCLQIQEFGQCPKQLFSSPHPPRDPSLVPSPEAATSNSALPSEPTLERFGQDITKSLQSLFGRDLTLGGLQKDSVNAALESDEWVLLDENGSPKKGREQWRQNEGELDEDLPGLGRAGEEAEAAGGSNDDSMGPWRAGGERKVLCSFRSKDKVSAVCLTRDGGKLYSSSLDNQMRVYDLKERRQVRSFTVTDLALTSLALLPEETLIAAGSLDNGLYLYSADYGRVVSDVQCAHDDAIASICVRGNKVLSGSWDSTVRLWDCLASGLSRTPLQLVGEHEGEVRCVDLSSSANTALSLGENGLIKIWDIRAATCAGEISSSSGGSHTSCGEDAASAVTAGAKFGGLMGGREMVVVCDSGGGVKLWDLGELGRGAVVSRSCGKGLTCVSTDCRNFLAGSEEGTLEGGSFFSPSESGAPHSTHQKVLWSVCGHGRERVTCLGVSEDWGVCVTGGDNCEVVVWGLPSA